ncbi:hypothetical protein ACFP56_20800, partial [Paenibacillus septentrionalis]
DLEQVASATNLLRQQINGNVNSWSGDLPIWGAMHNAQQSIARLTDDAEQLAEVVRKAIAGMERLEQENKRSAAAWLDQTRGLAQLLARFRQHTMATLGSLPEEMMRNVNRLIDKVEAWHRPDPFEKEPVIQQLRERLASATLPQADRIRIKAQIEEIYAQREVIAKAQRAYEMYKQYGNTAQMLRVHQVAEDSRLRLLAMGIQAQTIAANVDLTSTYAGSAVQACTFDPLYTKPIPIMDSERYRTLLMLGMKEGATGTWARNQLEEIVFHRQQLTTSTISVMQQLREGKLPKQDLSTMSTSALQLSRYNLYSKPKAIVEEQEIEKEEPIYKQIWNSLKEIGNDAIAASNDRWDRQFDSVYDFVNYWSGGLTGAVWEGAQERTNKWHDSVYDFSNYLLIGIPGMIKGMGDSIDGTFFPAEAWSKEHVSDMLGAVSIVGGGVATSIGKKTILNPVKPDLTPPNVPKVEPFKPDAIPDMRARVEANIEASTGIREATKIGEYLKKEKELLESIKNKDISSSSIKGMGNLKYKKISETSAEDVNKWWKEEMAYSEPPYKPGTLVQEIELTEKSTFVRVYDGENSGIYGGWFMKADDIRGLTPSQIQVKFALPTTPKFIVDVELDAGTRIRAGTANPLFGLQGGGQQFDLMGQRVGNFTNPRPLP